MISWLIIKFNLFGIFHFVFITLILYGISSFKFLKREFLVISLDKKRVQHRIPILSSIPYLGERLFTHSSEIESKTDLVIQITPRIIKDGTPGVSSGIEEKLYHKLTEEELLKYNISTSILDELIKCSAPNCKSALNIAKQAPGTPPAAPVPDVLLRSHPQ